jgi:hypothetical protein
LELPGHTNLTESTSGLVYDALLEVPAPYASDGLLGITCLARRADQLFARAVLNMGGDMEVVFPASDYADRIPNAESRARFDDFMSKASAVHTMPFAVAGPEAYMAASKRLLQLCDLLVAVWDGRPANGTGGTADAVQYAKDHERKTIVVWPPNARRG